MMPLAKFVFTSTLLLISGGCSTGTRSAQPAPEPAAPIGPSTLQQRYQSIWESVGGEVPVLVVHLGAAAGNQIAAWAKSEGGRGAAPRNWGIACPSTNAVEVREEVHDARFGVSKLAITRRDGSIAPLPCTISMGSSSANVVIPGLQDSPSTGRFSFLAYSCNEPFSTGHGGGIYARDLSLWLRMDARAKGENSRGQLPERPQFVLGLGDQIYVDPDPTKDEPLAFFRGNRSDDFLIHTDPDSLYGALDVVYRYNFSLPPLAQALSKLPAFMMWDDHEIRDGWGSQGDEMSEPMRTYFRIARHAFIANQLLRSYAPGAIDQAGYDALVASDQALHHQFSYGVRTHVLMLDSRSTRSSNSSIFEETAQRAVRDWLGRGERENGDLFVLTVGVPLFPDRAVTNGLGSELDDDLQDSWDSRENEQARAHLLTLLADHFTSNPNDRLLVLSGDVHYSSLYFLSIDGRVIGQEVVTSGIAHSLPAIARSTNWLLDVAKEAGRFQVTPAGKINNSASFAELVVDPGVSLDAPKVDLVFHANGTLVKGGWPIGNSNLLVPQDQPLWYYTYQYDYKDPLAHLTSIPSGVIPAGAVMPLPMELPQLRARSSWLLWPWGRNTIQSAIQPQSVFCTVADTEYNSTLASSWDLAGLASRCVRLTR